MSDPADGSRRGPAVLAFGGNALLPDPFHPEDQEERARDLARAVLLLLERSSGLVLVHGNGPQVGMILLRVEATSERLPAEPLDVLVAETQGSVGYLLTRALRNALREQGSQVEVSSILTQVVVDPEDPAFASPSKPVGPYYSEEFAQVLQAQRGWHMEPSETQGWRRVVPSPRPLEVVEMVSIAEAARGGAVVVAGGGGGIPVRDDEHGLTGVEAVIDKDRTAALLALSLRAESFVVLTGVPHVSRDFGTPRERPLPELSLAEARRLLEAGEFPRGSMRPKIEAATRYVAATDRPALVTDTASLARALEHQAGTWLTP
jgi:carbamate kinase